MNIIKGNIPIKLKDFKRIKQNKDLLRKLSDKKVSVKHEKKLVNQKGGFEGSLDMNHSIISQSTKMKHTKKMVSSTGMKHAKKMVLIPESEYKEISETKKIKQKMQNILKGNRNYEAKKENV